ncbi:hypothetical protein HDU89_004998 [Geranomyces variabilis]|nr:hypothetical protein HDU89_004998 [Geranomyces variabilis]
MDNPHPTAHSPSSRPEPMPTPHRRAPRACDSCRKRRSKCTGALPCPNCTVFGYVCNYSETPRQASQAAKATIKTLESRLASVESLLAQSADPSATVSAPSPPAAPSLDTDSSSLSLSAVSSTHTHRIRDRESLDTDAETLAAPQKRRRADIEDDSLLIADGNGYFTYHGRSSIPVSHSPRFRDSILTLPFKIPMQDHIGPDSPNTIDALLLTLPMKRDEIMKLVSTYFAAAHPFLPIVDRSNFYVALSEGPGSFPFRCLLLAVLIVGAHLSVAPKIPISTIDKLCDMCQSILIDYEVSHVLIAQAALVLSVMNSVKGQKFAKLIKSSWKLVGVAVRGAQELGLHRSLRNIKRPMPSNDASAAEETRRRTWAGCYIMDRIVSMCVGRPCMIRDEDWDALPPQGFSDIAEERADSEYLHAQLKFAQLSGLVLQRVNSAHAPWKSDEGGGAATAAAMRHDLEIRMRKWRDELPDSLAMNDSHRSWTRRELLHVRFHTVALIIQRSMGGMYDAKSIRSSLAVIRLLETFSHDRSPSPDTPDRLLLTGMPMTAMIAWDALFPAVTAGNADALTYMNRLHQVMETLAHKEHHAFLVLLMLCADSLDARGIESSLSHRKVRARIERRNSQSQSPSAPQLGELMGIEKDAVGDDDDTLPNSTPVGAGPPPISGELPRANSGSVFPLGSSFFGSGPPDDPGVYANEDQLLYANTSVGGSRFLSEAQGRSYSDDFLATLLGDETSVPWDLMGLM